MDCSAYPAWIVASPQSELGQGGFEYEVIPAIELHPESQKQRKETRVERPQRLRGSSRRKWSKIRNIQLNMNQKFMKKILNWNRTFLRYLHFTVHYSPLRKTQKIRRFALSKHGFRETAQMSRSLPRGNWKIDKFEISSQNTLSEGVISNRRSRLQREYNMQHSRIAA